MKTGLIAYKSIEKAGFKCCSSPVDEGSYEYQFSHITILYLLKPSSK